MIPGLLLRFLFAFTGYGDGGEIVNGSEIRALLPVCASKVRHANGEYSWRLPGVPQRHLRSRCVPSRDKR